VHKSKNDPGTTVNAPLRGSSAIEWKPYEGWTYRSECPTCTVVGAYKYLKNNSLGYGR